jgi:hypothetical protein
MSTLVAQTISNGTVSTSSANVIQGSAKAWVSFQGNPVTIFASYNVSSITRFTTGDYTINFTNAFSDKYYSCSGTASNGSVANANCYWWNYNEASQTASSMRIILNQAGAGSVDAAIGCFQAFR